MTFSGGPSLLSLVVIGGVPVDNLTMLEALDRIEAFIASRQPHQIATVNVDFIVKAQNDPELMHILQEADMITADGMPVVWGSRLLHAPLKQRVAGSDMVPLLAERGARKGWRFYFVGAAPGVAVRAAEILSTQYPGLKVVGVISPPLTSVVEMPLSIVHEIRSARPDILFVAFGNPKQEKWIHMHLRSLDVPVAMGVGGTLDFIAGAQRRAPNWMQVTGTEWIHRLFQDPKRMWKRYTYGFLIFGSIISLQWRRHYAEINSRQQKIVQTDLEPYIQIGEKDSSDSIEVRLIFRRSLTAATCELLLTQVQNLFHSGRLQNYKPKFYFSMQDVRHVDTVGISALVQITRHARAAGGDLFLEGIQPLVRDTFREQKIDRYLTLENTYWVDTGSPYRLSQKVYLHADTESASEFSRKE